MAGIRHDPDEAHIAHLQSARRMLALPIEVSRLHWHPFGVYTIPMAKRLDGDATWSRRLHIWHPSGTPVGEASPYGVHTHSGTARSHVLAGTLFHHVYDFEADPDGAWDRAALGDPEGRATLVAHEQAATGAGVTHTLPANQPHGVSKPPGFAISLFEQLDGPTEQPFTTWQRNNVPAEPLVLKAPVPLAQVLREATLVLEQALFETA